MKVGRTQVISSLIFILVCLLLVAPSSTSQIELNSANWIPEDQEVIPAQTITEPLTGALDPLLIEHKASAYGLTTYSSVRTDTVHLPNAEVLSPVGGLDNTLSADCNGGYFLVGEAGAADFGSPAGTISLWLKFDSIAPNGRFWGQDYNFETRWASNRLTLDWGADNTLQGLKSDWEIDHWYFIHGIRISIQFRSIGAMKKLSPLKISLLIHGLVLQLGFILRIT